MSKEKTKKEETTEEVKNEAAQSEPTPEEKLAAELNETKDNLLDNG